MRDWLVAEQVSIAAMGSTSAYWKGPYYCLVSCHTTMTSSRDNIRLELMLEDPVDQAVVGRVRLDHGVGAGDVDRDDNGETDPLSLADLARGARMRSKIPDLAQALTGTFDPNHAQLPKSMPLRLRLVEQAQADLDQTLAAAASHGNTDSSCCRRSRAIGENVAQVILAESGGNISPFRPRLVWPSWVGADTALRAYVTELQCIMA